MTKRVPVKRLVSVLLAIAYGAFAGGCGSSAEPSSNASPSADDDSIPGSSETHSTFGVDHWSQRNGTGNTVITGADASGKVRVELEQDITTDGAGVTHGVLTTSIDGATTTMRYAVSAAGQGTVEKNEFPKTPRAVQAARDALADFKKAQSSSSSQGGLVQTKRVALSISLRRADRSSKEASACRA